MNTARTVALNGLLRVSRDEGYSNIVIDKELKKSGLDSRDSSLASALFYGVLERRLTLDAVIEKQSTLPLKKLSPEVLEILRLAVYQLLYMDKIPASAAVNEAVNMAKARKLVKASGFINGILRSIVRKQQANELFQSNLSEIEKLSLEFSCPKWLIELWQKAYGSDCTLGILSGLSGRPPLTIRVNTLKTNREELIKELEASGVKARPVQALADALELEHTGSLEQIPAFGHGLFHVQDVASQLCCSVLKPQPGQRMADVCSAPGGKAFTSAELMEDKGEIFAYDLYPAKINLIKQGAERLGIHSIQAQVRDASKPGSLLKADKVLCDAPCSGLGILRRKPEIRYKPASALDSLPDLQYLILCESAKLVDFDGTLVYSTCTLNPAENGEVARRFLKEHPAFEPMPLLLPESVAHAIEEPENELTLMPHVHGTDGFFIAAFHRMPR